MTKKTILETYSDEIKPTLDKIYEAGFYEGRHSERKTLIESGYLSIKDPEALGRDCEDPCKFCQRFSLEYKIGCTQGGCEKKKKQRLALKIKENFGNS